MLKTPLSLLCAFVAACGSNRDAKVDGDTPAPASPTENAWTVRPDSFGVVPLGVPFSQAAAALNYSIAIPVADDNTCHFVRAAAFPKGTSLMALRQESGPVYIERVDVDSAGVLTAEGAGVGETEARVLELYGNHVQVTPHKYTGPTGHYLVVPSARDTMFRIVFETDGQRVTKYRAGRRPAVDLVERCG